MALIPAKARTPLSYLMIFGLLAAVYLLPADTSLSEVRRGGLLRACMPPVYPPLVTSDANAPGIDVELLRALAEKLALKLVITPNPAIGQDFNPRNWRVTRAQCDAVHGDFMRRTTWMVHAWVVPGWESRGGVFAHDNPAVVCANGTTKADKAGFCQGS